MTCFSLPWGPVFLTGSQKLSAKDSDCGDGADHQTDSGRFAHVLELHHNLDARKEARFAETREQEFSGVLQVSGDIRLAPGVPSSTRGDEGRMRYFPSRITSLASSRSSLSAAASANCTVNSNTPSSLEDE
jgi:hypothetical protein